MTNAREKLIELIKQFYMNNFIHSYQRLADHLIANGVTISKKETVATDNNVGHKWIPVTERLPEVIVPVLTYGRKGAVGIGFTQPTSVTADGKVYFYPRYGDNLPTHWMPLPEPPKGE